MRTHLLILVFLFPVFAASLCAATEKPHITMNFPEAVIADTLQRIVPLSFAGVSSKMEGTVTIAKISNFRLLDQQIFCHLDLVGNNLNLVTRVANQDIRLKLGSARVNFDCDAEIRYDGLQKKLFIRPVARGINGPEAIESGDIGKALLLFLNGQEFGIAINDLEPIIADASNKTITIHTKITDIRAMKGMLQVSLAPVVAASPK